jgi:hypothetical protein
MAPTRRSVVGVIAATLSIVAAVSVHGPVEGQPAQPDVVIVGDSLTGGNASYIRPRLHSAGLDARVEGLSSRRIAVPVRFLGYRDSGIDRIRSLRAAGVDPDLWVIQLGTNDLGSVANCACPDRVAFAGDLIDRLLTELPPNRPVAWVTVMNRADFDITNTFNEALRRRAAVDPYLRLIDWAALSLQRPDWFLDAVHQNVTGLIPFTQLYVDEIRSLLADPPGPVPSRPGVQRSVRLGVR